MLYLGADHGGFRLKEALKAYLGEKELSFQDLGAFALEPNDDYPNFGFKVAEAVAKNLDENLGILVCRSGMGEAIAANKVKGIRAGNCWSQGVAKAAREDDHINILVLPADYINEASAKEIVEAWLKATPKTEEKYLRRIQEIKDQEE